MKKMFTGVVTSVKMSGVATVEVTRQARHPKYGKSIKRTKKYHVANAAEVGLGDKVRFVETRPLSKTVRWTMVETKKGDKKQ